MSKKNKRKLTGHVNSTTDTTGNTAVTEKAETQSQPQENKGYDMNKDIRNLAIIAIVLIASLAGLYYYNQQTHVLQQITDKLFALF